MRYFFIDIFRFIAIIFMVQGHTFDVLLSDIERKTYWFKYHDYLHGYVAAMFLFGAGIAFVVSTFRKWDLYISFSNETKRRLFRYSSLIIIGYFLHLPHFSLYNVLFNLTEKEYLNFVQSDVLQLIGFSLLVTQLIVFLGKSQKLIFYTSIILLLCALIITPFIWSIEFQNFLPLWIASYFSFQLKSWFPFFPWISYLFGGVIVGCLFYKYKDLDLNKFFKWLSIISIVLYLVAINFENNIYNLFPPHDRWKAGTSYIIEHLSMLSIFISILYWIFRSVKSLPQLISKASTQSLSIYFVHLLILYGCSITSGLKFLFYREFSLEVSLLLVVGVLLSVYIYLKLLDLAKKSFPGEITKMGIISIMALLIVFVTN